MEFILNSRSYYHQVSCFSSLPRISQAREKGDHLSRDSVIACLSVSQSIDTLRTVLYKVVEEKDEENEYQSTSSSRTTLT
jgi:hypothetical protein